MPSSASYPTSVKSYTDHANLTEIIDADHPNSLQYEVMAIESTLGADDTGSNPLNSPGVTPSSVWDAAATSWPTVHARLVNIEKGIAGDSHNQYVKNTGGSTIIPTSTSTKGLIVKAYAGQTANLQEWQDSSGTANTFIDKDGVLNGAISSGTVTTKGDLLVGNTSGTAVRLGVGSNGTVLTADSSATNGVKWSAPVDVNIAYSFSFLTMGAC